MNGQGGAAQALAPQGPAKILNLRLPRNLGQSPVAARELLTAPGAGGSPDLNAIIQALMRTMQPPMTSQGQMAQPPSMGAPQGQQAQFHAAQGQLQSPLQGAGLAFPGGGAPPPPRFVIGDDPNANNRGPGLGSQQVPLPPDAPFFDRTSQQGRLDVGGGSAPTSGPLDLGGGGRSAWMDKYGGDGWGLF